ncbi:MAG: hypothetical protein WC004_03875 [Candidatus Absconditabacterales bacterium]
MGYIRRQLYVLMIGGCLVLAGFFGFLGSDIVQTPIAQAQSTVESIKIKIAEVVSRVDGKVTLATKTRLIEVISARIKTSYNPVIIDIYVFFLREVKKLRTSDEIVPIGTVTTTPSSTTPPATTAPAVGPDFAVTFAAIPGTVQLDQKFATLTIKFKNMGTMYSSDGLGSLKFGCKGIDGTLYPYRSYLETAPPIATNGEVTLEVPNVYIGNLTSNVGFKLLVCKIDSSNLVTETNEDNNFVNVTVQVHE